MSRARNIKPGFFLNEDLAEIAPMGRLLFIGLWTLADREGRLEDRPRRIKGELFPYDNCDVDSLLDDLQRYDFIQRYEAKGKRYIQITTFSKHQNPHANEKESEIPSIDERTDSPESLENADTREKVESTREKVESTREKVESTRADSLISDSLIPESISKCVSNDTHLSPEGDVRTPYAEIVEHYHRLCPSLPRVEKLTDRRKTVLRQRFADLERDFSKLDEFLEKVEQSDFLTGRGDGRFRAGFDWILKQANFVKILEGNYDNRDGAGGRRAGPNPRKGYDAEAERRKWENETSGWD